jgi:two-component system, OmpR family, response regulator
MKTQIAKTILLVDDDIDYLNQTKFQLEKLGHSVISAYGQKEAEKMLDSTKPDLAILDLMMENKDSGFILSWKIKQKYPDVPVIIATAVTADTGLIFGLESKEDKNWIKADLYLEKGLRTDQLNREINKLLKI